MVKQIRHYVDASNIRQHTCHKDLKMSYLLLQDFTEVRDAGGRGEAWIRNGISGYKSGKSSRKMRDWAGPIKNSRTSE